MLYRIIIHIVLILSFCAPSSIYAGAPQLVPEPTQIIPKPFTPPKLKLVESPRPTTKLTPKNKLEMILLAAVGLFFLTDTPESRKEKLMVKGFAKSGAMTPDDYIQILQDRERAKIFHERSTTATANTTRNQAAHGVPEDQQFEVSKKLKGDRETGELYLIRLRDQILKDNPHFVAFQIRFFFSNIAQYCLSDEASPFIRNAFIHAASIIFLARGKSKAYGLGFTKMLEEQNWFWSELTMIEINNFTHELDSMLFEEKTNVRSAVVFGPAGLAERIFKEVYQRGSQLPERYIRLVKNMVQIAKKNPVMNAQEIVQTGISRMRGEIAFIEPNLKLFILEFLSRMSRQFDTNRSARIALAALLYVENDPRFIRMVSAILTDRISERTSPIFVHYALTNLNDPDPNEMVLKLKFPTEAEEKKRLSFVVGFSRGFKGTEDLVPQEYEMDRLWDEAYKGNHPPASPDFEK